MKKTFEELQEEILELLGNDNKPITDYIIEINSLLFEFNHTSEYTEDNVKRITGRIAFLAILMNKELNEKPLVILENHPEFYSEELNIDGKIDFDISIGYLCWALSNIPNRQIDHELPHHLLLNIIYVLNNGEAFNGCLVDVEECLERHLEINRPLFKWIQAKNKKNKLKTTQIY